MAKKKYLDDDGLNYFYTQLKTIFVLQETGKTLSDNNFTDALLTKLNGIETGANKTIVDSTLKNDSTNPVQNKVIYSALASKATTAVATTTANGLMSSSDKTKLEGIETGANKTVVDSALSSTSANPVQNKVVYDKCDSLGRMINTLDGLKVNKVEGKGLSTNDFTDALKTKLENQADDPLNLFISTLNVDGVEQTISHGVVNIDLSSFAKKSDISNVYKVKGGALMSTLPNPTKASIGDVYNMQEDFTTTDDFVEGAGHYCPVGTNVVCVAESGTQRWDILGGTFNLTPYLLKTEAASTYATLDSVSELTTDLFNLDGRVATVENSCTSLSGRVTTLENNAGNYLLASASITHQTIDTILEGTYVA